MVSSSSCGPSCPASNLDSPLKSTHDARLIANPLSTPPTPREMRAPLECSSRLAWTAGLSIDTPIAPNTHRKTGIICTIGPSSDSLEKLTDLRSRGMNIVRLNMSHGTHAAHLRVIEAVRESEQRYPEKSGYRPVAIALDTKGPEIRLGKMGVPFMDIKQGNVYTVGWTEGLVCDEAFLAIDYPSLGNAVKEGSLVFIDDGNLQLGVLRVLDARTVTAQALNNHRLKPGKGVNLPNAKLDLPPVSSKDKEDLKFAVEQGLDMVFASFVRTREDVLYIRQYLNECVYGNGSDQAKGESVGGRTSAEEIKIIAKIENHEGIHNFDQILHTSDGVMVARGDLGVELSPEKVFVAQKMMIARAGIAGKPVICATQMLESMTGNPRPTRAEASDVANAVLDGADCVMLSAETASGLYPLETVAMMSKICLQAEANIAYLPLFEELRALQCGNDSSRQRMDMTETIACSAVNATLHAPSSLSAIIVLTKTGHSARLVAKYRPHVPIIVVTRHAPTARALHLHRGCYPFHFACSDLSYQQDGEEEWQRDVDSRFYWAMKRAQEQGLLARGGRVVCIQGSKGGIGHTNTMRILVVP